ncbi:MAG TPA: 5'/3'-nucleotidase SurE, partial [bacterium]|nr:5'/3'-nucleotidase SurE [bacterium]
MKVLLTNDDGYRAGGIWALAKEFSARGAKVTIVAPEAQRSAASHAVTLHKPLRLKREHAAEE